MKIGWKRELISRADKKKRRNLKLLVKKRLVSPITRRILAVNILALVFLGAGILYLDEYKKNLIKKVTQHEVFHDFPLHLPRQVLEPAFYRILIDS